MTFDAGPAVTANENVPVSAATPAWSVVSNRFAVKAVPAGIGAVLAPVFVAFVTVDAVVVAVIAAALAETTDNIPKPIDATATSATRLKVVFVDICFLSISQDQEFPELGFG